MTEPVATVARRPEQENPGSSIFVTGGAGTGKTALVVDRVVELLETRRAVIDDVLCIAGTEGDAAELRDRLHSAIARATTHRASAALADVRAGADAAICTMPGLARQVLIERGATVGVGPGFSILDAPAERADFDIRFTRYSDELLADPDAARALVHGFALGLTRDDVHAVAWGLHRRRDRLTDGAQLQLESARTAPGWAGTVVGDAVADALDAALALRGWGVDPEDRLSVHLVGLAGARAELASCGDTQAVLQFLDNRRPFTCALGQQSNWSGHVDEVRAASAAAEAARVHALTITGEAVVGELAVHLGRFVLRGAEARRVEGRLGVLDLLVLALRAFRADADAADALRRRYRYLLVDGPPDDPVELELLERLAAAGNGTTLDHPAPLRVNVRAVPGIVRFLNVVHAALGGAGDTDDRRAEDGDTQEGDSAGELDGGAPGDAAAVASACTRPGAPHRPRCAAARSRRPGSARADPTLFGAPGDTGRALAAMAGSGASPVVVVGGPMRAAAADVRRAAAHGAATAVVDAVTRGWAVAGDGGGPPRGRAGATWPCWWRTRALSPAWPRRSRRRASRSVSARPACCGDPTRSATSWPCCGARTAPPTRWPCLPRCGAPAWGVATTTWSRGDAPEGAGTRAPRRPTASTPTPWRNPWTSWPDCTRSAGGASPRPSCCAPWTSCAASRSASCTTGPGIIGTRCAGSSTRPGGSTSRSAARCGTFWTGRSGAPRTTAQGAASGRSTRTTTPCGS